MNPRPTGGPPRGQGATGRGGPAGGVAAGARYWLHGRRPVARAVAAGRAERLVLAAGAHGLEEVVRTAAARGLVAERLPRAEVDRLAGADAQGCAALVAPPPSADLHALLARSTGPDPFLLVACAHIQDPRNIGAIARTAEAVGAAGLVLPERRGAPVGAAAERTSAGALGSLPCAIVHNLSWALERCRDARMWVYGAAPDGTVEYGSAAFDRRSVLVLGSEGRGLGPELRRRCDLLVRLPMWGEVESLNVAVAAGVLFYEWARLWRGAPAPRR